MNPHIAKSLFLAIERLRGEDVSGFLEEMEQTQQRRPHEILQLQQERLAALLRFVSTENPFYSEKFASQPGPLALESLPLLSKQELRANFRRLVTPRFDRRVRLCKTSGSTGEPLKFFRDREVFGRTLGSVYRAHRWYGLDIGAREAMLWGIPSDWKDRARMRARDLLLNRFREREYDLSPEVLSAFHADIRRTRPEYLFGYSSMIYEFALYCRETRLEGQTLGLRAAICTAESVHDHQRAVIEEVLGCPVVSEYGSAETGIISYQCPHGRHHVSDDVLLIELLDKDGRPVPDGAVGRVVVTVLFSHAAPIIRYDLGDLAVRGSGACPCGVGLSTLEQIVGRTSGIVVTPSGRCFHSIALYYIMKDYAEHFSGIKQFRVRQTHLDRLEFHLTTDQGFSEAAREWLGTMVRRRFGDEMRIEFLTHERLERAASGKLTDFESLLDMEDALIRSYRSAAAPVITHNSAGCK